MGNCLGLEGWRTPSTASSCSSSCSSSPWAEAEAEAEEAWGIEGCRDLDSEYRLGRELGRGQFGVIRACTQRASGRSLACKSIPIPTPCSQERMDGVLAEAQMMQKLGRHPHIVQLVDVFRDRDHVHLVMERCRGGDLFDRLASKGRFPEPHAASLLASLLHALLHCHRNGIIHRDVKPENLLLVHQASRPPSVKLADFGLALDRSRGYAKHGMVGSTFYMAPEMLEGGEYSEQVDVWSAGVILYLLLSGAPPFGGETEEEIYDAIREGNLDFTSDPTWRTISASAKDLITKILCSEVSARIDVAQVLEHPWILQHTTNLSSRIMDLCPPVDKDNARCPKASASRDGLAEPMPPFTSKSLDMPSQLNSGLLTRAPSHDASTPMHNSTKFSPSTEGLFSKCIRILEKKVFTLPPHFNISIQVDKQGCTHILLSDASKSKTSKTLVCQQSSLLSYLLFHGRLKDEIRRKVVEQMPFLENLSWLPSEMPVLQLHLSNSLC